MPRSERDSEDSARVLKSDLAPLGIDMGGASLLESKYEPSSVLIQRF